MILGCDCVSFGSVMAARLARPAAAEPVRPPSSSSASRSWWLVSGSVGGAILFPDEDTSVTILTVPVPVHVCACVKVCAYARYKVWRKVLRIFSFSNLQLILSVFRLCPGLALDRGMVLAGSIH